VRQEIISSLVIVSLIALGLTVITGVILYAFPPPFYEEFGTLSDYPPSSDPYMISAVVPFFLASTDTELIALSSRSPRKAGCWIHWSQEEERFIEPCFGTKFRLDGTYLSGPPMNMDRYQLKLDGQKLLVETTRLISNPYRDDAKP
jgi:hypothetical protein